MASGTPTDDVFINCPFDTEYKELFHAIVFAIYACGFRPRCAREMDDSGQMRMDKLYGLIHECRYGIHDISRTELDDNGLPRFNMPFELGIFLGARRYGDATQNEKRLLIFDREKYRYQKFISDLAGMDIHSHTDKPAKAIEEIHEWLSNVSRRTLSLNRTQLVKLYRKFIAELPKYRASVGLATKMSYVDYQWLVTGWLNR